VNGTALQLRITTLAVRKVFVVIVMGIVIVDHSAAVFAGRIMIVPATNAERDIVVALRLIAPDSLRTVVTNRRSLFQTVVAKNAIVKDLILVLLHGHTATGTVDFFAHNKNSFIVYFGLIHGNNI
jgi:hypothetical protein